MISNWDIADLYDLVAGDLDCAAGALAAGADGAPAAVAIIDGGADRDWNRRQARWMLLRYALAPADPPPAKPSPADPLATRRLEDRVIRLRLSWMPPAADLPALRISQWPTRRRRNDCAMCAWPLKSPGALPTKNGTMPLRSSPATATTIVASLFRSERPNDQALP